MPVITVEQFAKACSKTPAAIRRAQKPAVTAAAVEVVKVQRRLVAIATGGDSRLSGVGKRGARLSVGFDVKGLTNATAIIQARGPWQFIERDTEAHRIPRQRSRRARKRVAVVGDGPEDVYASVMHPGTSGKHPFERGWQLSQTASKKAFADVELDAIAKSVGAKRT